MPVPEAPPFSEVLRRANDAASKRGYEGDVRVVYFVDGYLVRAGEEFGDPELYQGSYPPGHVRRSAADAAPAAPADTGAI